MHREVAVGGKQRVGEDELAHKSARKAADRVGAPFCVRRRGKPRAKSVKIKERSHRHRREKEQIRDDRRRRLFLPFVQQKADGTEHKKRKPHRQDADSTTGEKQRREERGTNAARKAAVCRKRRDSGKKRQEPEGAARRKAVKCEIERKERADARPRREHTIYGCRCRQAECKESQRNETHGSPSLFSCRFFPYII